MSTESGRFTDGKLCFFCAFIKANQYDHIHIDFIIELIRRRIIIDQLAQNTALCLLQVEYREETCNDVVVLFLSVFLSLSPHLHVNWRLPINRLCRRKYEVINCLLKDLDKKQNVFIVA